MSRITDQTCTFLKNRLYWKCDDSKIIITNKTFSLSLSLFCFLFCFFNIFVSFVDFWLLWMVESSESFASCLSKSLSRIEKEIALLQEKSSLAICFYIYFLNISSLLLKLVHFHVNCGEISVLNGTYLEKNYS